MNTLIAWHHRVYLLLWRATGSMAVVVGIAFIAAVGQTLLGSSGPFEEPLPRGQWGWFALLGPAAVLFGAWALRRKPWGWEFLQRDA